MVPDAEPRSPRVPRNRSGPGDRSGRAKGCRGRERRAAGRRPGAGRRVPTGRLNRRRYVPEMSRRPEPGPICVPPPRYRRRRGPDRFGRRQAAPGRGQERAHAHGGSRIRPSSGRADYDRPPRRRSRHWPRGRLRLTARRPVPRPDPGIASVCPLRVATRTKGQAVQDRAWVEPPPVRIDKHPACGNHAGARPSRRIRAAGQRGIVAERRPDVSGRPAGLPCRCVPAPAPVRP
jgi:hypothetical protein